MSNSNGLQLECYIISSERKDIFVAKMTNRDFIVKVLILFSWLNPTWVCSAPRQPRLSLAEPMPSYFYNNIDGHPGTYAFGYDVLDAATGNTQYRSEERYPNGTVAGSYGYLDPVGRPHRYRYIADEKGYRVTQDRPPTYAVPIISPNALSNNEGDTVTWTRKKPNHVMAQPEKRKNKIMWFPGKYTI